MSILDAILCKSEYRVEAGGLVWGLRRLSAAALLEAGHPALQLAALRPAGAAGPLPPLGASLAALKANAAAVCLAVYEVAEPGKPAEPVTLVPDREAHDPAQGRVWIELLPAAVRRALSDAIAHQDGEVARGIAASFPVGPADPPGAGPDSAAVRPDP